LRDACAAAAEVGRSAVRVRGAACRAVRRAAAAEVWSARRIAGTADVRARPDGRRDVACVARAAAGGVAAGAVGAETRPALVRSGARCTVAELHDALAARIAEVAVEAVRVDRAARRAVWGGAAAAVRRARWVALCRDKGAGPDVAGG